MEGEVIEARVKNPSIEDVNRHLLNKLDELIEATDAKTNPELVKVITESVAKLNASLKGNDIFTPQETAEEKKAREAREAIERAMKGE
jgi:hypothetical protein